jgi:Protein of unknown function (DUF3052)
MAGYSGTPLAQKLSLKDGLRTWWSGMPASVRQEIEAAGLALVHLPTPEAPIDAAHVFVTGRAELDDAIETLRPRLAPTGFLWISWPKRSAALASEVTEDEVRRAALPTGLVDIKVCAIDETWSGLKLVIRRRLR